MVWKALTTGLLAAATIAGCAGYNVAPRVPLVDYGHAPSIPSIAQAPAKCTPISQYIDLEAILQKRALEQGAYLFGNALDEAVAGTRCMESLNNPKIPPYLLAEQEWTMEMDKETHRGIVYQAGIALMELEIATGGSLKDYNTGKVKKWPTPSGTFYINRIVLNPYYYHPKWSQFAGRKDNPGKNNPYGTVLMELTSQKGISSYDFYPPGHIGINFHSTNKWKGPGNKSHGCVRGFPQKMEELAPAIVHYFSGGEYRKNARGTIYQLKKAITVRIRP